MKTPIFNFVKRYAKQKNLRLHMPGHKGKLYAEDITEIDGAGVLYSDGDIISESENNCSTLFGTGKTVYSAEGSSLSIKATVYMLTVWSKLTNRQPKILAVRNAHKSFINAVALCNARVEWLFPKEFTTLTACPVTANDLDEVLSSQEEKPTAFYITSPDYLGNIADINGIAQVCKKHGVLLVVDNAHGAYLNFLQDNLHPINLGADICVDSAHKTLPVLTGGAYLHISKSAPDYFKQNAKKAMSIFASTSPSYLILSSLDRANAVLYNGYKDKLSAFAKKLKVLKTELVSAGYTLVGGEDLKITISAKPYGYTGKKLADYLLSKGIVCEFYDEDFVVLMFSLSNKKSAIKKVKNALLSLEKFLAIEPTVLPLVKPTSVLSPTEALFAPSEVLPIDSCVGKILSSVTVSCPPAVPILVCGERVDEDFLPLLKYYGIKTLSVVKE